MREIANPDPILDNSLLHFVRWHPGVESSKAEISRNAVCSRLRNHRGSKRPLKALDKNATDYIFKNGVYRFVSVVRRPVQEARERVQRKEAETELIRRERYFRRSLRTA